MKPTIHYVSLFSGIEAFSVAASRIPEVDWRPVFFSEIDPFASAVLADHFPDVPNLGDITQIQIDPETNTARNHDTTVPLPRTGIDLLAGGSPCQDVSVAGKRAGMQEGSGTRSSLAFEYARLVRALRPRVLLWENVPGVLSSNGGRDFGAFLHTLAQLGYGLAWRVLDVQYARVDSFPGAVPQRRRRVWLVGCLGGDGRVPAQVLFERPGLLGDTAPSREAGKGFAAPPGYGPARNDRLVGTGEGIAFDRLKRNPPLFGDGGASRTLTSHTVMDAGMEDLVVARTASFDGHDCSPTLHRPNGAPGYSDQEVFGQQGAYLARAAFGFSHVASGVILDCKPAANAVPLKAHSGGEGAVAVKYLASETSRQPCSIEVSQAIGSGRNDQSVALGVDGFNQTPTGDVSKTVVSGASDYHHVPLVALRYIVRRLTPGECETLQAFPQGWTKIPYRGKPASVCPDSPRYKALGNSWGTNCAEWILRRLVAAMRLDMI